MFPKQILSFQGKQRDFIGVKKDVRQGDKQNGEAIHCLHQSRLLRRCTWHLCACHDCHACPVLDLAVICIPHFAQGIHDLNNPRYSKVVRSLYFFMFLSRFVCFVCVCFRVLNIGWILQAMNQTVSEPRNSFHAWRRSVNGHWQTRSSIPTSHLCKASAKLECGKPIWQSNWLGNLSNSMCKGSPEGSPGFCECPESRASFAWPGQSEQVYQWSLLGCPAISNRRKRSKLFFQIWFPVPVKQN